MENCEIVHCIFSSSKWGATHDERLRQLVEMNDVQNFGEPQVDALLLLVHEDQEEQDHCRSAEVWDQQGFAGADANHG